MMIGKSSLWQRRLKDIDKHFIDCVVNVWPQVVERLKGNEKEDRITERLVDILRKDRSIIRYGFLYLQFKLRQEDTIGDFFTKGIIDMALFLDQDYERYIAYECKRLNTVSRSKKRSSLAGKYCEEGIIRYVTNQYAEKLPFGCMIAYVMDGDMEFAIRQLQSAITQRKMLLKFKPGKSDVSAAELYKQFTTIHTRSSGTAIEVRHRLFSILSPP